jgi:hypothetical protein
VRAFFADVALIDKGQETIGHRIAHARLIKHLTRPVQLQLK